MSIGNVKDVRPVLLCGPGRTKKEFVKRCDINEIIRRYRKTGQLDLVSKAAPVFADLSNVGDFRGMVHKCRVAAEAFEGLPVAVRSRFGHEPAALVEFLQNDENRDEAVKLGLIVAPSKESVVVAPEGAVAKPPVVGAGEAPAAPEEPLVSSD